MKKLNMQAVRESFDQVLVTMAEAKGLDPRNLPPMPDFHNCGVL